VPGLLDVISRAAAHRLDRAVDARPGSHDDDRRWTLQSLNARQQVEPFGARRRITGVVHVHEQRIEVAGFDGGQHGAGRGCGLYVEALALEQELEGLEDIWLIVSYEETWRRHVIEAQGARGSGLAPHSVRNATTGSMRVVARAGMKLATAATTTRNPVTTVSVA